MELSGKHQPEMGPNLLFNSLKMCTGLASFTYTTCLVLYLNTNPNNYLRHYGETEVQSHSERKTQLNFMGHSLVCVNGGRLKVGKVF